jgi:hypothetical protein
MTKIYGKGAAMIHQLHYRPTTLLNKHAPIVTKRVEINNLNGIIQKFSMPDK